jgi:hypothetical protein
MISIKSTCKSIQMVTFQIQDKIKILDKATEPMQWVRFTVNSSIKDQSIKASSAATNVSITRLIARKFLKTFKRSL